MNDQPTTPAHTGAGLTTQRKVPIMHEFTPTPGAVPPDVPDAPDAPDVPAVASPALSVEEVIEQARTMRRRNADDIAQRLARGERLSAERLYDVLHSQKLAGWWLMIDRHIRYSPTGRGLTPARVVAKYVSWISPYLEDNAPGDPVCTFDVLRLKNVQELALAHLDRALALIRQDAARTFLEQASSLAPTSTKPKQPPSSPAGQDGAPVSGHPTTGEPEPATPTPAPGESATPITPAPPARDEALSMEAVIEQARETQRRSIDGIARKLHRGQQPSAEQLYDVLHAQTLGTWWALIERKTRDTGDSQGQALARFLPLISFCLEEDDTTPDVALCIGIMAPDVDHEFTFIHLNRAMDLIRRQAARTFLEQVMSLAPTCPEPEQSPSAPAGKEATA